MMFKHESCPDGSSNGRAHIQDLQVNVQGNGGDVKTPIVEPLSISCTYDLDAVGGSEVSVVASNAEMWMSYSDIKLISAIGDTMSGFSAPSPPPVDHVIINGILAETRRGDGVGGGATAAPPGPSASTAVVGAGGGRQDWAVECASMKVTLINDCGGFNEPFCTLQFDQLRCARKRTLEGESLQGLSCHVAASLFNTTVIEFEPILEDWSFAVEATAREQPAQTGLKLSSAEVSNHPPHLPLKLSHLPQTDLKTQNSWVISSDLAL